MTINTHKGLYSYTLEVASTPAIFRKSNRHCGTRLTKTHLSIISVDNESAPAEHLNNVMQVQQILARKSRSTFRVQLWNIRDTVLIQRAYTA